MATIIDPLDGPRFDTRGLPEGYDPHMLYEYRFQKLKNSPASGLEWLLYQYIPESLIKSFAFAIDPTGPFKVAPGVITPENRTKYRATLSVLDARRVFYQRTVQSYHSPVNYNGVGGCIGPGRVYSGFQDNYYQDLNDQGPVPDWLKDTTSRTRLMGSKQGTLSMFKGHLNSPPRTVSTLSSVSSVFVGSPPLPGDNCIAVGGTNVYQDGGTDNRYSTTIGYGARLPTSTHNALRLSEISYNEGLSQANIVSLLKGWSPFNRDYTLFRNLAELRDIPRSIRSLEQTIKDFRKLYVSLAKSPSTRKIIFDLKSAAKDIPNEYLSYHFGWKQTYKDLVDLLNSPYKISKRINFLISRSGQPTTFRSKREFVSGEKGVSGFEYEYLRDEFQPPSGADYSSRIERSSELRLVINAVFDFPPISSVRFRNDLWLERLGVVPRVTDVYNLVPWSWLVDYFTGFGNYVELIDNINHDPSLINWGVLTCVTQGKLTTDFHSKSWRSVRTYAQNQPVIVSDTMADNRHTSVYEYVCETRRDVASLLDVNTTSEPSSLTAYQKSIIGALLLQRLDHSRPGTFRPRS